MIDYGIDYGWLAVFYGLLLLLSGSTGSYWWLFVLYGLLLLGGVGMTYRAWREYSPSPDFLTQMAQVEERRIGAILFTAGIIAVVIGASVALGVVGIIAGLGNVPQVARTYFHFAALFCSFAVFMAAWIAAGLSQYVHKNLALEPKVNIGLAFAACGMVLGVVSLTVGIWMIVSK